MLSLCVYYDLYDCTKQRKRSCHQKRDWDEVSHRRRRRRRRRRNWWGWIQIGLTRGKQRKGR